MLARGQQALKRRIREFLSGNDTSRRYAQSLLDYDFVYDHNPARNEAILQFLRKLRPQKAAGYEKIRVGAEYDGGYVMLNDFKGINAAYSLGINRDVSWDLDIAARGIDVFQYDHTISALPEQHEKFHWTQVGISAFPNEAPNLETLPSLMERNLHLTAHDLILKCDIEGNEWSMFAEIPNECLTQFRQITAEMHNLDKLILDDFYEVANCAVDNLVKNHVMVHVHANNFGGYCIVGGIPLPNTLELTFIRIKDYDLENSNESFPTLLDRPNKLGKADYWMGNFRF